MSGSPRGSVDAEPSTVVDPPDVTVVPDVGFAVAVNVVICPVMTRLRDDVSVVVDSTEGVTPTVTPSS